tara:strand:- start:411 stop:638 length:228 start_codon:yes stop_codon:yes gene_type:complete
MKKISRKNIVKRLDTVFSLYIRLREADNEMVECYTCGKISHYKKGMQCGHFHQENHIQQDGILTIVEFNVMVVML